MAHQSKRQREEIKCKIIFSPLLQLPIQQRKRDLGRFHGESEDEALVTDFNDNRF